MKRDTQHNNVQYNGSVVLLILMYPECLKEALLLCHYDECRYAECHYAECHYAECHYAECRGDTLAYSP
jgi:hypothetical protein